MNEKQKGLVVGGSALSLGVVSGYAILHERAQASKAFTAATKALVADANSPAPVETYAKALAAQRLAFMSQVPVYPTAGLESGYLYLPVTSYSMADKLWRVWLDKAADLGLWDDAWAGLIYKLQQISDEMAKRLNVPLNPNWLVALQMQSGIMPPPSFDALFGDAQRAAAGTNDAWFTYSEAAIFWDRLMDVAITMDVHTEFDPQFWGLVWAQFSSDISAIPSSIGDAAAKAATWVGQLGAKATAGLAGGFMSGLFSSWITPVAVLAGVGLGGAYLYRRWM